MPARDDDDELEDEFEVRVRRQRERIEKGRAERQESFWNYLGLFGVVGWSVIIPMVIGVLLGRWMDHSFGTVYRWTRAADHGARDRLPERLADREQGHVGRTTWTCAGYS